MNTESDRSQKQRKRTRSSRQALQKVRYTAYCYKFDHEECVCHMCAMFVSNRTKTMSESVIKQRFWIDLKHGISFEQYAEIITLAFGMHVSWLVFCSLLRERNGWSIKIWLSRNWNSNYFLIPQVKSPRIYLFFQTSKKSVGSKRLADNGKRGICDWWSIWTGWQFRTLL